MNQALGLAVSGTDVRLAHLASHKGQIRIESLQRAKLKKSLEYQAPETVTSGSYDDPEVKDAFEMKAPAEESDSDSNGKLDTANLEILYQLLEKYTKNRIRIGFNVPLSMVNYVRHDNPFGSGLPSMPDRNGKDSGPTAQLLLANGKDGPKLSVLYERQPPTMVLLRDVNNFVRGRLSLSLMDTAEVALANIARASKKSEANDITAIIYIEDEFTRLIFLRGGDLFHVSSIIHESISAPDILEVIYRKLIYEQDEVHIPEITAILLAGRGNRIDAKEFFRERFENAMVSYLYASALAGFAADETQRETFSEFAVPIALAWKLLQPRNPAFLSVNLLPQELLDQQQVLKLNLSGYALLAITGLTAFLLTWQILSIRSQINSTSTKNSQLDLKIKGNQPTVDKVLDFEDRIKRLKKNLSLSDSLSNGHQEFLSFLENLNTSVMQTGGLWVDEISKQPAGFSVKGTSFDRDKIPLLAEKLGRASLSKVTRAEAGSRKLFQFELERRNVGDNVQLADHNIRIIEPGKTGADGSLVLRNDVERRATAKPQASPAVPSRDEGAGRLPTGRDSKAESPAAVANGASHREPSKSAPVKAQAEASKANPAPLDPKRLVDSSPAERVKIESSTRLVSNDNTATARTGRATGATTPKSTTNEPPPALEMKQPVAEGAAKVAAASEPASGAANSTATAVTPAAATFRAYTIEAATSYTRDFAEQYASGFRKKGYEAVVEDFQDTRRGATRYRVLVGMFPTEAEAEMQAQQLQRLVLKGYRIIGL